MHMSLPRLIPISDVSLSQQQTIDRIVYHDCKESQCETLLGQGSDTLCS
jgi:hypothetical protein